MVIFFFNQKGQNFVLLVPNDFVQILPACGPNTYQIMYGATLDFQCQHQQYKIPDRKINLCSRGPKFAVKNFPYYRY